jgi:hypothetical protein
MQNKLDLIRLGNFKFQGEKILHFVCWWCWILLDACHSKKKNFCGLNDSNDLVKASWLLHLSLHIQIAIIRHASQLMHGITELTTSLSQILSARTPSLANKLVYRFPPLLAPI